MLRHAPRQTCPREHCFFNSATRWMQIQGVRPQLISHEIGEKWLGSDVLHLYYRYSTAHSEWVATCPDAALRAKRIRAHFLQRVSDVLREQKPVVVYDHIKYTSRGRSTARCMLPCIIPRGSFLALGAFYPAQEKV